MNEIANEKLRNAGPNEKSENMKYNFKNFDIIEKDLLTRIFET